MKFSREIGESLTLKFGQIARDLQSKGHDIISMAVGEPNFETPAFLKEALFRAVNEGYTHYSNSQGLMALREAIVGDLNARYFSDYKSEDVMITPGVKSALHLSLSAILEPGDEVIILSPYYVSYPPLIKIAEPEAKIIDVPVNEDHTIDLLSLSKAFNERTKCIIVNSPSNPSGKMMSQQEITTIIQLAKQYDSYILSDEIYEKLVFNGQVFHSFLGRGADERLIYTNGYSKSYCLTGWRIGYVVAPSEVMNKMLKLQQNINTNTNTFVQKAVLSIYQQPHDHLSDYLVKLEARMRRLHQFIRNSKLMKGQMPEAGFFYFVDISASGLTSLDFAEKLIKTTGIVVTPGIGFGPHFDQFVRFSLAIDDATLDKVLDKLAAFEASF